MRVASLLVMVLAVGCGAPSALDAGVDAGSADAGAKPDAGPVDAGPMDAGPEPDAGPPPPRTVFGTMTVNGATYTLSDGYGSTSTRSHVFRLGTPIGFQPRVMVSLVLPSDAGAGFSAACGGPENLLFSAQYSLDAGVAFFTIDPTCQATLSQVAAAVDEQYQGTFSGTAVWEPRSVFDAGFRVLTITNGSFTVTRTF